MALKTEDLAPEKKTPYLRHQTPRALTVASSSFRAGLSGTVGEEKTYHCSSSIQKHIRGPSFHGHTDHRFYNPNLSKSESGERMSFESFSGIIESIFE